MLFHLAQEKKPDDPDAALRKITPLGGIRPEYFPAELLMRGPIRMQGRGARGKNVLENLRKLEARDGAGQGGQAERKRKEGELNDHKEAADGDVDHGENEDEDGDFGDDDYI